MGDGAPRTLSRRTFVTGQPGSGKTTLVMAIVQALMEQGVRCKGFYTEECREAGMRVGFDVVTIPEGVRAPLARKKGPTHWPKVGSYSVDVVSFERVGIPSLLISPNENVDVVICDEIGRMELKSPKFIQAIRDLLRRKNVYIFGAITAPRYGHRVPFCDEVSSMKEVEVHNIKKSNRDHIRKALRSLALQTYVSEKKAFTSKDENGAVSREAENISSDSKSRSRREKQKSLKSATLTEA
ncbi:hypothetical protein AAMO2058_000575500 [Amorphochlora amoebiformis]